MKKVILVSILTIITKLTFGQISFGTETVIDDAVPMNYISYAFDLNNDDFQDALSCSFTDGVVKWYANDGFGNFGDGEIISNQVENPAYCYAADFDNDGWLDIAIVGGSKLAWVRNLGNGTFDINTQIITSSLQTSYYLTAADFDEDFDTDIVVSESSMNSIYLFQNDGNGNFSQTVISGAYANPMYLEPVDMDDDGDLDILTCSQTSGGVDWFENMGSGVFSTSEFNIATMAGDAPYCVQATDIDFDGDKDVYVAFWNTGIFAYTNEGGSYVEITIDNTIEGSQFLELADLDSDGDQDLLAVARNDDLVLFYENDGFGGFSTQNTIATISTPSMIYPADIDTDGDPDVLVASENGEKLVWYENTTALMPFIYQDPYTTNTCNGSQTYLSLKAENTTSYQWFVSTDFGTNYDIIYDNEIYQGATTDSLIIYATTDMDSYIYICEVCNGVDNCITSYDAYLFVGDVSIAEAGQDTIFICEQSSLNIAGNPPQGADESGYWYSLNEELSFADEFSPSTQINNLPQGETIVFWLIENSTCYSVDSITIKNNNMELAYTEAEDFACENGEYQLYGNDPINGEAYWSFSQNDFMVDDIYDPMTSIWELPQGEITCTWTIENGACISQSNLLLKVQQAPELNLADSIEIYQGETITIDAGSFSGATYYWLPNGETTQQILVSDAGLYSVEMYWNGCKSDDSTVVVVKNEDVKKNIPNTFTPNGDGANDTWKMPESITQNAEITIVNKAGSTVANYTTKQNPQGWDGTFNNKPMPTDVYWYIINFDDGTTQTGTLVIKR